MGKFWKNWNGHLWHIDQLTPGWPRKPSENKVKLKKNE